MATSENSVFINTYLIGRFKGSEDIIVERPKNSYFLDKVINNDNSSALSYNKPGICVEITYLNNCGEPSSYKLHHVLSIRKSKTEVGDEIIKIVTIGITAELTYKIMLQDLIDIVKVCLKKN